MTEDQAKNHLAEMLKILTLGSILHLLAEVIASDRKTGAVDDQRAEQSRRVEDALFVLGLGVDAALPT